MAFEPVIKDLKLMDAALFKPKSMKLRKRLLNMTMADRLYYDAAQNILFANLSGLDIEDGKDLKSFKRSFKEFVKEIGCKVNLISNYDGISIAPRMSSRFADLLSELERDYYLTATRYTNSAFLRQKLGQDLKNRSISPHIFETVEEAAEYIRNSAS
jgi:propionate CoA-transferase